MKKNSPQTNKKKADTERNLPRTGFNWRLLTSAFLIVLSAGLYLWTITTASPSLFTPYDPETMQRAYDRSQWSTSQNISPQQLLNDWALKKGYTGWDNFADEAANRETVESTRIKVLDDFKNQGISDTQLYQYVGYRYITGLNPALLNPEHPPLGKYLIGLSILLFGSAGPLTLSLGLATLLLLFFFVYRIRRSIVASSAAVFLLVINPFFSDQIRFGPQLELSQGVFLLIFLYFFSQVVQRRTGFVPVVLAGVAGGLFLSVKTVLPHALLMLFFIVMMMFAERTLRNRTTVMRLLILGLTTAVVFTLTYLFFFIQGGTIRSFFGLQKYIIEFYRNSSIPVIEYLGNYLRLIFTGYWKFWDAEKTISLMKGWSPIILVEFIVAVVLSAAGLRQKDNRAPLLTSIIIFFLCYNMFLFFTPVFPRYLYLLYLCIISIICTYEYVQKKPAHS